MIKLTEAGIREMTDKLEKVLAKARLDDEEKERLRSNFRETAKGYRDHFGEDTEVRFRIHRQARIEIVFSVKEEKWNVFEEGADAEAFSLERKVFSLAFNQAAAASWYYFRGYNVVVLRSSVFKVNLNILKQPLLCAVIAGIGGGLLCGLLPQPVSEFIVDDVVSPVLSLVLRLMNGFMGPFIFLSLVTAVNTLESINELNHMGFRLFRRFLLAAASSAVITCVVGVFLFGGLAPGRSDFDASLIVDILLSIIPTGLFTPFVENNIPQLVVLGIALGAMLLVLGERTGGLADILQQTKEWINRLIRLILKIIVLVPLLSIFRMTAKGEIAQLLQGWKYIVGIFLCLALSFLFKLILVSVRSGIGIPVLLRTIRPLAVTAFKAGSDLACLQMFYTVSKEELGIEETFVDFWVPMNQAMLAPSTPISLTMAALYVAELTNTPLSFSFLQILLIIVLELSLASPGFIAGLTILCTSLGMTTEYIGIFSVYGVFIRNTAAAFGISYRLLEEIRAAGILHKIKMPDQPGSGIKR